MDHLDDGKRPVDRCSGVTNASSLNVQALDAAATIEGQGVTLLTPAFFRRELAMGA